MAGKFDPQNAQNLMETYWNLLEKVPPRNLTLTKIDEEIFEDTRASFPELFENDNAGLIKLNEDFLKNEDAKKRWRDFHARYEKKVKDYNFGCLIRTDAQDEYGERSTIFVTRLQFYAVEISRNRLGLNDKAHELAKAEAAKDAAKKEKEAKAGKKNGGK
ncbi:hypothetical protein H0H93_010716 [Arthromyces matolae]|nr:hypothetical protein H0H93_010716 [Arthromyces matolae]